MDEFNALAKKSENHPVEYFASADPKLFVNIINKFMGGMSHGGHATPLRAPRITRA
jgi:cytochrome o ubiquinol oxidase subunit 2